MTFAEFDQLFESRIKALTETRNTKGRKYTEGDEDRLKNFKDLEPRVDRLVVWEILFHKHWSAIQYFLKTKQNIGEDICDTHIHDCIMYLHLLEGLIKEKQLENFSKLHSRIETQKEILYSGLSVCTNCHCKVVVANSNLSIRHYCIACGKETIWVKA